MLVCNSGTVSTSLRFFQLSCERMLDMKHKGLRNYLSDLVQIFHSTGSQQIWLPVLGTFSTHIFPGSRQIIFNYSTSPTFISAGSFWLGAILPGPCWHNWASLPPSFPPGCLCPLLVNFCILDLHRELLHHRRPFSAWGFSVACSLDTALWGLLLTLINLCWVTGLTEE